MKTLLRGGIINGQPTDVLIEDGLITALGRNIAAPGSVEWNLEGGIVFPGFVDVHVHFNEPGRADWEGLSSGSKALALGGGTAFMDMPLNSDPPVLDAESFQTKRRIAEEKSCVDFALWGGLCPGSLENIPSMAEAGAAGFKAFLSPSGIPEFPHADAKALRRGMVLAHDAGLPVAVHAEDPAVLDHAALQVADHSFRSFLKSRPIAAEVSAIRMACDLAGETGAALHVVHVSSVAGLEAIQSARASGVDVTAETCPHYLLFDEEQAVQIGARAKCAPPLRPRDEVEKLWQALDAGMVDTLGSDHSPAPPGLKTGEDFFAIWGGISGCQHGLIGFLGELEIRYPGQSKRAAQWLAETPAARFRLPQKGKIEPGFDADICVLDFVPPESPAPAAYRHPAHLYEFLAPRARVRHVFRRGENLVRDGVWMGSQQKARFLQPRRI